MKNSNLILLIVVICIIIGMIFMAPIIYLRVNYSKNLDNQLVKVYYANQDILSGEVIYANVISTKNIKATYVSDEYVLDVNSLVGKCVRDNVTIKDGDIFKSDFIGNCE